MLLYAVFFVGFVYAVMLVMKLVYKLQHGVCTAGTRLEGRVAIVTGASAGIGKETAMDLAQRGARVIMACRNLKKAQPIADEIKKVSGNEDVEVRHLDTSDLASVRRFAREIIADHKKLHILVNNAGIVGEKRRRFTEEGLEVTMATNHYGHFLLTNMLGGLLKEGSPSRVVWLTSLLHSLVKTLDPLDINFRQGGYTGQNAYNLSKLCNILISAHMARKLNDAGITSYAVHPGICATELLEKCDAWYGRAIAKFMTYWAKDSAAGAQPVIHCAVDPSVAALSGRYWVDCKPAASSPLAQDSQLAERLWDQTAQDVGMSKEEALLL